MIFQIVINVELFLTDQTIVFYLIELVLCILICICIPRSVPPPLLHIPNNNPLFLYAQEYSFQITMRQQWNDKRLAYKNRLNMVMAGKNRLTGRNVLLVGGTKYMLR